MVPKITLQPEQLAELEVIRDTPPMLVRQAVEAFGRLPKQPLRTTDLNKQMKEIFKGQQPQASALLRQMFSLHGFIRQTNLTAPEVFAGIRSSLESPESRWTKDDLARWNTVEPLLKDLFSLDVIYLSTKALDLSYDYSELLQRTRILTDIRPVFGTDGKEIRGVVISHTLIMHYDNIEGEHTISLAIDQRDIRSLLEQCTRALTESQTAEQHFAKQSSIPILVPGRDPDAE